MDIQNKDREMFSLILLMTAGYASSGWYLPGSQVVLTFSQPGPTLKAGFVHVFIAVVLVLSVLITSLGIRSCDVCLMTIFLSQPFGLGIAAGH